MTEFLVPQEQRWSRGLLFKLSSALSGAAQLIWAAHIGLLPPGWRCSGALDTSLWSSTHFCWRHWMSLRGSTPLWPRTSSKTPLSPLIFWVPYLCLELQLKKNLQKGFFFFLPKIKFEILKLLYVTVWIFKQLCCEKIKNDNYLCQTTLSEATIQYV